MSPPYALDRKGNMHHNVDRTGHDYTGKFIGLARDDDQFGVSKVYTESIAEFNEISKIANEPFRKASKT